MNFQNPKGIEEYIKTRLFIVLAGAYVTTGIKEVGQGMRSLVLMQCVTDFFNNISLAYQKKDTPVLNEIIDTLRVNHSPMCFFETAYNVMLKCILADDFSTIYDLGMDDFRKVALKKAEEVVVKIPDGEHDCSNREIDETKVKQGKLFMLEVDKMGGLVKLNVKQKETE